MLYPPAGGEPVSVRVIANRPDTIVGFGDYSPSFRALFLELVTKGLLVAGMLARGLGIRSRAPGPPHSRTPGSHTWGGG
jgi:hypothetical protein